MSELFLPVVVYSKNNRKLMISGEKWQTDAKVILSFHPLLPQTLVLVRFACSHLPNYRAI